MRAFLNIFNQLEKVPGKEVGTAFALEPVKVMRWTHLHLSILTGLAPIVEMMIVKIMESKWYFYDFDTYYSLCTHLYRRRMSWPKELLCSNHFPRLFLMDIMSMKPPQQAIA